LQKSLGLHAIILSPFIQFSHICKDITKYAPENIHIKWNTTIEKLSHDVTGISLFPITFNLPPVYYQREIKDESVKLI